MNLHYFGTDLDTAGHYFFEIYPESIRSSNIRFEKLPFNPESLPYKAKLQSGERKDYHAFGYTILAVSGSVADKRSGCKSIFFVEEEIPFDQMERLVRQSKFGNTVLDTLLSKTPQP